MPLSRRSILSLAGLAAMPKPKVDVITQKDILSLCGAHHDFFRAVLAMRERIAAGAKVEPGPLCLLDEGGDLDELREIVAEPDECHTFSNADGLSIDETEDLGDMGGYAKHAVAFA